MLSLVFTSAKTNVCGYVQRNLNITIICFSFKIAMPVLIYVYVSKKVLKELKLLKFFFFKRITSILTYKVSVWTSYESSSSFFKFTKAG